MFEVQPAKAKLRKKSSGIIPLVKVAPAFTGGMAELKKYN
jgi:hypothetical protein